MLLLLVGCVGVNSVEGRFVLPADSLLCEGDMAFRCGRGLASEAVLAVDGGVYSHVGIVVKGADGWSVVHITPGEDEPEKIKAEALDVFFAPERAKAGAIMRVPERGKGGQAAKRAQKLATQNILFDHTYNIADTTKMYCTEFVWHVFGFSDFSDGDYILPHHLQTGTTIIYQF